MNEGHSVYQMFSASYTRSDAGFEAAVISASGLAIFNLSIHKIKNRCMERGGNAAKKVGRRLGKGGIRDFFEREFDWIALLLITVIILLSLVFF